MLKHLIVAGIATVMAVLGMELIALRDGRHVELETLRTVIPISIGLWLVFSLVLRGKSVLVGIYVGFLSPFLGGLMALPPYGLVIVLTHLTICTSVGIATGLGISVALRLVEES